MRAGSTSSSSPARMSATSTSSSARARWGPGGSTSASTAAPRSTRPNEDGLELLARREATPDEDAALDAAAAATVAELGRRGLIAEVVSQRLNRRKIDLIPEPEWADPPKARIAELLAARSRSTSSRAGSPASATAVELAVAAAQARRAHGSARDERREARRDRAHRQVRLRPLGVRRALRAAGSGRGSCSSRVTSSDRSAAFRAATRSCSCRRRHGRPAVSVGAEPSGTPAEVHRARRRPRRSSRACSPTSSSAGGAATCPSSTATRRWTLTSTASTRSSSGSHESLLTLADGRLGTRGAPLFDHPSAAPGVVLAGRLRGRRAGDRARRRAATGRASSRPRRRPQDHAAPRSGRPGFCARTGQITSLRFSSLARPGTVALRAHAERTTILAAGAANAARQPSWPRCATAAAGRPSSASAPTTASRASPQAALADAEEAGFERLLREHREAWARRWRERRRRDRGRPRAAARGPLRALPPDGVGRRPRRGCGRSARLERRRVQRARLLGQRRLRAPVPRRDPPGGGASDARVPNPPAARRPRSGTRALGRRGRPLRLGVGRRRPRRDAGVRAARDRRPRPHPHRRARGAHRRRRRLGGGLLPRLDRRRRIRDGAGRASSSSRPPATGPRGCASTRTGGRTSTA